KVEGGIWFRRRQKRFQLCFVRNLPVEEPGVSFAKNESPATYSLATGFRPLMCAVIRLIVRPRACVGPSPGRTTSLGTPGHKRARIPCLDAARFLLSRSVPPCNPRCLSVLSSLTARRLA